MKFAIEPMQVGARIVNFAAGAENDPEVKAGLYDAWLKHGVLVFDNVDSIEKHLAMSQCFGELEIHPYPPVRSKVHPLLIELGGSNRIHAYVYDDSKLLANVVAWHRDTAYTPDICKGAMLRMVEVAEVGGETMLCDTAAAYDTLPSDVKAKIENLEYQSTLRVTPEQQLGPGSLWKKVRPATREEDPEWGQVSDPAIIANYPSVIHPVVLVHPESRRKCIFLSPTYVDNFLGMDEDEGEEFLEYLVDHMLQPRFVMKHKWKVNEALLWDNRRMMHAACGNPTDQKRKGFRTTLAGPTRTGRYVDPTAKRPGLSAMVD